MDVECEFEANNSPVDCDEEQSSHVNPHLNSLNPEEDNKGTNNCSYKSEWVDDLNEEEVIKKTFDSTEEAEIFYNLYAKCVGFSIRKSDLRSSKSSGAIEMRRWVCSKEGFRENKWLEREDKKREPRPLTRTGCLASFRVNYNKNSQTYVVSEFKKTHNHELLTEEGVSFLFSHRNVKKSDILEARSMHDVGWRTSDIMKFFAHRSGGYHNVGFTLKDLYNYLNMERREEIKDGDAECALTYLREKKATDPSFYFKYEVDQANRLCRLFWAESRCLSDYKNFGDVLVFDTTYRTNAYEKPLVILAGINNHYMTTIFAAALLSDESEETYVWVLETLIAAMEGKKPISVITDGDIAMRAAIEKVLPEARHRLCSWHLQRNAAVNVHSACFCRDFHKSMKKVCTEGEFEKMWEDFIHKQHIENNSWVKDVYSKREKWAEAFLRGHFFGNMKCTQRCEGMNAFLKKHVNVKMRLYEFVRSFDSALAWLRYMEAKENAITTNSTPVLSTHLKDIEEFSANLLTRNMFFIVREEIKKEALLLSRLEEELGSTKIYSLSEYSKPDVRNTIKFHKNTLLFECSCLLLETVGWPCAHIFAVMKAEHINEIPSTCILKRWTRNAKDVEGGEFDSQIPRNVTENARYGALVSHCNKMCYYASLCDEGYHELWETITRVTNTMKEIYEKSIGGDKDKDAYQSRDKHHFGVNDPVITKTKGTGGLHSKSNPRRCSKCRLPGHNKATCPKSQFKPDGESSMMDD